MPPCHCQPSSYRDRTPARAPRPAFVRSAVAVGLSFLVAFFPKCPMCWAALMSALGVASVAQLPYMGILFPVLVAMLGVHLFLLWKQVDKVGYGPLLASMAGTLTVLLVRTYASDEPWALRSGILLMLGGSVWHSFAMRGRSASPPSISITHTPN
jgi:hypothetical protein